MKTNAIVRIVLFSLAILILLGILLAGLGVNSFLDLASIRSGYLDLDEDDFISDGTVSSSGSVDASQIKDIEIDWVAGSITVQPGDVEAIEFSETGVSKEKYRMIWKQRDDELVIQFCQSNVSSINSISDISKDLVITVPRDWTCDELDIDAASARVSVSDLTIRKVDFDGTSGVCTFDNCAVDEISVDTVSGDIRFTGTLDQLNCDAVSANCTIELSNAPSRISMEGVSGDLDITLPESCGFAASIDTVSGDFSSDFATTVSGGKYTCGDESCRISISGVSGDLYIRKDTAQDPTRSAGHHAE